MNRLENMFNNRDSSTKWLGMPRIPYFPCIEMLKTDNISYILNDPDAKFTNVKNDRIAEKLIFIAKTGLKTG